MEAGGFPFAMVPMAMLHIANNDAPKGEHFVS